MKNLRLGAPLQVQSNSKRGVRVTCAHNVVKILSGLKVDGDNCRNCVSG